MPAPRSSSPRDVAIQIVRTLQSAGHVAYLAGGCVRDRLLGLEPKDYDVATDAPPEVVLRTFKRSRHVGEAFAVVLVTIEGVAVEVATFRAEWGYEDGRRPSKIEFTDAPSDAKRRDFTINGLFENPLAEDASQRVIDYVGGVADLRAGVIRAIGEPDHRFAEDYLRMLRAVRFAARFGFTIEQRTAGAIRAHGRYLGQISRERIGQEVGWMLAANLPAPVRAAGAGVATEETHGSSPWASPRVAAAQLMQQLSLDSATLNEDHRDAPLPTLGRLAGDAAFTTALAAWLLDRHTHGQAGPDAMAFFTGALPRTVTHWRRALCLSNEHRDALAGTLALVQRSWDWPSLRVAHRKRLLAQSRWPEALRLLRAASHEAGVAARVKEIERDAPPLEAEGVAPPAIITGDDLIQLGRRPGPAMGRLLDDIYDAQLEGAFDDRESALRWLRERGL